MQKHAEQQAKYHHQTQGLDHSAAHKLQSAAQWQYII